MGTFKIRRDEHEIVNTHFASFLASHLRSRSWMTVYNKKTQTWFLAFWVNRDKGLAIDVEDLGPNMELANRQLVQDLERAHRDEEPKSLRKMYERAEKEHYYQEIQEAQEDAEVMDWAQKRAGSDLPVLMG